MSSRRSVPGGVTLGQRLHQGQDRTAHCWIIDGVSEQHPGLVIRWERSATGWTALVAYVQADALHVEQVPADRLRPAVP